MGLSLNIKKTEPIVISKKKEPPTCAIRIGKQLLQQVHNVKNLGTRISADGKCKAEVTARIMQAKKVFGQMKHLPINQSMTMKVHRRVLDCYILPVLMYGCEAWTIRKETENQLRATEMWLLRRMLRISYMDKTRNEEVLERAGTTRSLVKEARERQAVFFGHVMRRKELEHLVTTGKIDGKRSRGRQREKILDSVTVWLQKDKPTKTISFTWNCERWRSMVFNAMKHGTELR